MTARRALITGGGGQLGSDLQRLLGDESRSYGRPELDVTNDEQVARAFEEARPQVVFNCAAFHNVEVCETEEDRSFEVNARAVKRLAQRCAATGARLVHVSTNYVFDGTADGAYTEEDRPNPRSIYALSKLAGEYAALTYAPGAIVARTAGLYGLLGSASKGGNFVSRMVSRAREQGSLQVVADQRLTPTYTADLAEALIEALDQDVHGLLHLTASGACSWHEFTVEILGLAGIDIPVQATRTTIPPGAADRPLNGVLDRRRADALGLTQLRHWRDALEDYMGAAGLRVTAPADGLRTD